MTDFPGAAAYFPLQVGNVWIYAMNSRISTSTYVTRRVTRSEIIAGKEWFVVAEGLSNSSIVSELRFRVGDEERIYQLTARGDVL